MRAEDTESRRDLRTDVCRVNNKDTKSEDNEHTGNTDAYDRENRRDTKTKQKRWEGEWTGIRRHA